MRLKKIHESKYNWPQCILISQINNNRYAPYSWTIYSNIIWFDSINSIVTFLKALHFLRPGKHFDARAFFIQRMFQFNDCFIQKYFLKLRMCQAKIISQDEVTKGMPIHHKRRWIISTCGAVTRCYK